MSFIDRSIEAEGLAADGAYLRATGLKLVIQVPCYNEEATLARVLDDLPREIDGIETVEFQIIDDGSSDRTVEVAIANGVHHIVRNRGNKGLARTFQAGINNAIAEGADSGASTVWLAKRAGSVVSIDHDAPWVEFSAPRLAEQGNAQVELVPADARPDPDPRFLSGKPGYAGQTFRAYVDAIERHEGLFDLIVIDGRARTACLEKAVGRLAQGGLIVFDNSHRSRYRKAIAASGLHAEVTRGLVPSLPLPDQTTLLTR